MRFISYACIVGVRFFGVNFHVDVIDRLQQNGPARSIRELTGCNGELQREDMHVYIELSRDQPFTLYKNMHVLSLQLSVAAR